MHKAGGKPGEGVYFCKRCGQRIAIKDSTETLPKCPRCSHKEYRRS